MGLVFLAGVQGQSMFSDCGIRCDTVDDCVVSDADKAFLEVWVGGTLPADAEAWIDDGGLFCGCVDGQCQFAEDKVAGEECTTAEVAGDCSERRCGFVMDADGDLVEGCVDGECTLGADAKAHNGCTCEKDNECLSRFCSEVSGKCEIEDLDFYDTCNVDEAWRCPGECVENTCIDWNVGTGDYCELDQECDSDNCVGNVCECQEVDGEVLGCWGWDDVCIDGECVGEGFLPEGWPCEYDTECHSDSCENDICTLSTVGLDEGDACNDYDAWIAETRADARAAMCINGVCIDDVCVAWGAAEGEDCYEIDEFCENPFTHFCSSDEAYTCQPLADEGEFCDDSDNCLGDLLCNDNECVECGSVANNAACDSDSACSSTLCAGEWVYDEVTFESEYVATCKGRNTLAKGAECLTSAQCESGYCTWEGLCDGPNANGEACDGHWDCESGFCGWEMGEGDTCDYGDESGDGWCDDWQGATECHVVIGVTCADGDGNADGDMCGYNDCDCDTIKCVAYEDDDDEGGDDWYCGEGGDDDEMDYCDTALVPLIAYLINEDIIDDPEDFMDEVEDYVEDLPSEQQGMLVDFLCCQMCGGEDGDESFWYNWMANEAGLTLDVDCDARSVEILDDKVCSSAGDRYGMLWGCADYGEVTEAYKYKSSVDLCGMIDCGAHGECINKGSECECSDDWTGAYCQNPPGVPPCTGVDCENGGTCIEATGKCDCAAGYTDPECGTVKPVQVTNVGSHLASGYLSLLVAIVASIALF